MIRSKTLEMKFRLDIGRYWSPFGTVLFESWKDQRMLEVHRNCGFLETEIDQMSDRQQKSVQE